MSNVSSDLEQCVFLLSIFDAADDATAASAMAASMAVLNASAQR